MRKRILCLSTSNYHPIPTRKQNIMNRLTDCDIIYADPPVSYAAPLKDEKAWERLFAYKKAPEKIREGLWVYALPPVLPFANKSRAVNVLNRKKLAGYCAKLCKERGFGDDFILWCYSPQSADIVAPLAEALGTDPAKLWKNTVYDCVDRHSAYPGMIDPKVVDGMEEDLARKAGCCIATASGLFERLKAFNPNTHFVPNGVDFARFGSTAALRAARPRHAPDEPVMGFVGMIQECTDKDCLVRAAKAFPKGKLVIIGRRLPGVDVSALEAEPNIELLPPVPQEKLPEIMADFDVCLNCFADVELSKDVSPLKFYEYLATGIPVVSTPVPLQVRDYADCVYIAEGAEDFTGKLVEALSEKEESGKKNERIKRAEAASWDERVLAIRKIVGI